MSDSFQLSSYTRTRCHQYKLYKPSCSHNTTPDNTSHQSAIDDYYTSIMTCIHECTQACIPVISSRNNGYNVPGWTDLVKEKEKDLLYVCNAKCN